MAPHAIESILQPPQWPLGLSNFVTWCLMWDPKNRPTSKQAMEHEFFADAVDPLRPKSSSRLLGRKHSDLSFRSKEATDSPLQSKPSWFRRSLIARDSAPAVPQHIEQTAVAKQRPQANKRATWTHGTNVNSAPMPILPSIKPISPLPNAVNAQGTQASQVQPPPQPQPQPQRQSVQPQPQPQHLPPQPQRQPPPQPPTKQLLPKLPEPEASQSHQPANDRHTKIGRQLSVNSHGNHYTDAHRLEAERALNGSGATSGLVSPPYQKESFFSHLRKRARRFSGRHGLASPGGDDVEAQAAAVPWSNRSSMIVDSIIPEHQNDFADLDHLLQNVRYSLDKSTAEKDGNRSNQSTLKRTHSVPRSQASQSGEDVATITAPKPNARNRKSIPQNFYDTPEEEDELLDEVLRSANRAARRLGQAKPTDVHREVHNRQPLTHLSSNPNMQTGCLTPSPSAKRNGVAFDPLLTTPTQPLNIQQRKQHEHAPSHWPTPPYEENEWPSAAAASIYTAGGTHR